MATTTNLTALKINYLTQQQYDTALANGQINSDELYLTPQGPSTPASHTHGNIGDTGVVTATVIIANGDRILITDSDNGHKVVGSSISFDGSTTTKALTQKGTWETFASSTHTHTTAITSSTSTPTITLAASTTYKLTAGGTDFIFKTPADSDTKYTVSTTGSGNAIASIGLSGTTITATLGSFATSTHTHTTSIVSSTGTSVISLSANTKYQLTTGGTSVIFTTPVDNDSKVYQSSTTTSNWRKVVVGAQNTASAGAAVTATTSQVYVDAILEYQPSSGTLRTKKYVVDSAVTLEYNSTTKSLDFIFN